MKINIALPVYNEEQLLAESVKKLIDYIGSYLANDDVVIVIADNGSADQTGAIATELEKSFSVVQYLRLEKTGKGLAVFSAWKKYPADLYVFMDIDLSTDLSALPELINAVKVGGVAYGSRFLPQSKVTRSFLRKIYSRIFRDLVRVAFASSVSDAPCGFKAISADVHEQIVPTVEDQRWFFDTELLIRAEQNGFKPIAVPIIWREVVGTKRKSRVNVPKLAVEYFLKVIELRKKIK